MCGIFGIVTGEEQLLGPTLIDAGHRLSYRGYDSVGCATIHANGIIELRKDVGKVDPVAERLKIGEMTGKRGMMQLRWATFGSPSQVNAQPHLDSDGDMVGAHNGNVVNNLELRQQFIAEGMTVRSENDGETCVHAVERYVKRGFSMIEAIQCAYQDLGGDYAFVIGRASEDCLYAFKEGVWSCGHRRRHGGVDRHRVRPYAQAGLGSRRARRLHWREGRRRVDGTARAGRDHHGPRRPRQDVAARCDPQGQRGERARPAASPSTSAPIRW